MSGIINCIVVRPPGSGDFKTGYLEDIATLTGGQVISKELGLDLDEFLKTFDASFLGKCDKVVSDAKATLFVGGRGDKTAVKSHIEALRQQLKASSGPVKEILEERVAKLTSGVSVVKVGAKTEVEAREKVERVKDAVGSCQSALAEGYVAGSGVTFLQLASVVKGNSDGAKLFREVLEQPIRKVMSNSGVPTKNINDIVETLRADKTNEMGFNVMEDKITNIIKDGIIDSCKVIRLCIENSHSVATSVLTTEVLIDFEPPRNENN
jgi:chaperonin GroEL